MKRFSGGSGKTIRSDRRGRPIRCGLVECGGSSRLSGRVASPGCCESALGILAEVPARAPAGEAVGIRLATRRGRGSRLQGTKDRNELLHRSRIARLAAPRSHPSLFSCRGGSTSKEPLALLQEQSRDPPSDHSGNNMGRSPCGTAFRPGHQLNMTQSATKSDLAWEPISVDFGPSFTSALAQAPLHDRLSVTGPT